MGIRRRALIQAALWSPALVGAHTLGVPARAASQAQFKRIALEENQSHPIVVYGTRRLQEAKAGDPALRELPEEPCRSS